MVDGMATAVEDADILVVCISQNYFDSKNCKKELEYADELGTRFSKRSNILAWTVRESMIKERLWSL